MHLRLRSDCGACISACNPVRVDMGAASNARRHADLGYALVRRRLTHSEGVGQHPSTG